MAILNVDTKVLDKIKLTAPSPGSLEKEADAKTTPALPLCDAPQAALLLDEDWDAFDEALLVKGTAFASEHTLRQLWDTPEEDEAWRDL